MTAEIQPDTPRRVPWRLYCALWVGFWLILYSLGVRDYLSSGGRELRSLSIQYLAAALISTVISVVQLVRAVRIDGLLDRPARWFARFWRWMPVEILAFVAGLPVVSEALAWLSHSRNEALSWDDHAYNAAKFFLFYLLFGGIQFALRSHSAWARERVRAAENARLAKEAQLAQLAQQLHPHFMFNALNTISSLIYSDPRLADVLLGRLATLLRAATSASRTPEHPLANELELLQAYSDIMVERFRERVRIGWTIDPRALSCAVPTLALQPLLENCFRHVVDVRQEPTQIWVRARIDGDEVVVEIEDDGETQTPTAGTGVGLGNLERRLQSLHGNRAGLELVAAPRHGLIARVRLPCAS